MTIVIKTLVIMTLAITTAVISMQNNSRNYGL